MRTDDERKMGVQACRNVLLGLELAKTTHAGLSLNRNLKRHKPKDTQARSQLKQTPEEELLEKVAAIKATPVYESAFKRWAGLSAYAPGYEHIKLPMELISSLAVGLGNECPLEVGLTTHHTYGMPLIPGSAIKGMCRRAALMLCEQGKLRPEQFQAVFGDQNCASIFVFWDAWYDPSSVDGKPFHRDVITVHHQSYYGSKGKDKDGNAVWPTDFDDPNPVPFLVVKPGAKFLFALDAPTQDWGKFVRDLLEWSLIHLGIGGKTNAGYGYFVPASRPTADPSGQPQRPSHTFEARNETWENVTVSLNPGSGELRAQNPDGKWAIASGKAAQDLRSALPEAAQQRLKDKKKLQADVAVSIVGNQSKIVGIIPKE